ncbi:hypothetical protein [Trebonia sp.]|uniref:hypothetical protein n=1 Tax=Trebonia sp. TaxID=2767075 RepID=UPI00262DBF85|nr:hypothetical protein [Trebonia sp.]
MGSLGTSSPAGSLVLPDIPPITIRELTVGLVDLLGKADGLVPPACASIYQGSQSFGLGFARSAASLKALTGWAQRFGAVVACDDYTDEDGQQFQHASVTFGYFGVEVRAYAFVPVGQTGTT